MNTLKAKFKLFSLIAVTMITFMMTSCQQESIINGIDNVTNSALDKQFRSYEIIEIDNEELWTTIENQIDGEVNLEMRKASSDAVLVNWSFKMNRIQVEAEDFTMNLIGEGGKVTQVQKPETHVLLGQLNGNTGEVFMGITKENLRAEVIDGEITYMIEPLIDYVSDAKPNEYIKYNVANIIFTEEHTCGFDESQFQIEETEVLDNIEDRADDCLKVEVMYLGDYDLYRKFSNYDHAFNWMYWRVVDAGRRYYSDNSFRLNLIIKKGWLHTWNSNIATSGNSTNFLTEWRDYANNNASWIKRGDANILFTGRNTGGSTVGAAWRKSICNSYSSPSSPYAFVEYLSTTNPYRTNIVTAHEIGHILGAGHSSSGFMTANLNNGNYTMSNQTRDELNGWVWDHSSCLGNWRCQ